MPKFRVRITRTLVVKQEGFLEIEAVTEAQALDLASEQDDPDMREIESEVEYWDAAVVTEAA